MNAVKIKTSIAISMKMECSDFKGCTNTITKFKFNFLFALIFITGVIFVYNLYNESCYG